MNTGELQAAIYNKLTGDAAVMALVNGVFADKDQPTTPEDDADFPYIMIGEDQAAAWDTKTTFGVQAVCQIDVWSRQNNYIEAKGVSTAVYKALHYQPLTIVGADHVMTIVESTTFTKDADGHTKRGLILARVVYDEI